MVRDYGAASGTPPKTPLGSFTSVPKTQHDGKTPLSSFTSVPKTQPVGLRNPDEAFSHHLLPTQRSHLKLLTIVALLCLIAFAGLLFVKLEMFNVVQWPIYVTFVPLWILPVVIFLAAVDFASSRISADHKIGKMVVLCAGFLAALLLMLLSVLVCLKLLDLLSWNWIMVLLPVWLGLVFSQLLLVFLIPGFMKAKMKKQLFVAFSFAWLSALSALLISLKLDGELLELRWWQALVPAGAALVMQASVVERVADTICLVLVAVWLCLCLPWWLDTDFASKTSWEAPSWDIWASSAAVFAPLIFALSIALVQVCREGEEDF